MKKISIVLIDDHQLVRETWAFLINSNPEMEVMGEAPNAEEGIELSRQVKPDVVLLDINLPGMNGIEATKLLKKYVPGCRIIGVSLHTQPSFAKKMIQYGALGYVTKNSSTQEMFEAIREVAIGNRYLCAEIKNIFSEQMINGDESQNKINALSEREIQIIGFVRKGYSSREIAESLYISTKTAEVHRYNILRKLGLKNSAALINFVNNHLDIAS